jgi:hypothetical protein
MPPIKKSSNKLVVELGEPQEKKMVTRYDSNEDDSALANVYVNKAALKTIGSPARIRITIEAA